MRNSSSYCVNRGLDYYKRRIGGFSLLELAVAVAAVAILIHFLLGGLEATRRKAAEATRQQVVATIEAALRYEAASRMARGRASEIGALANESPVRWMQERPRDYLGEFPGAPSRVPATAAWYWDSRARQVVFLLAKAAAEDVVTGREATRYRIVADSSSGAAVNLVKAVPPR